MQDSLSQFSLWWKWEKKGNYYLILGLEETPWQHVYECKN